MGTEWRKCEHTLKSGNVTKARLSRGNQQQRETCSDEVRTLHTSGLETLNGRKLALSSQLIKKTIFEPPPLII